MRWLLGSIIAVVIAVLATGYAWIQLVDHDPSVWHVDPATIARSAHPNDYLAAPAGRLDQPIDRETATHPVPPDQLIDSFKAVALAAPRTQVVAETLPDHLLTVVQRTPVIGFPDYISARAIAVEDGSALVVWSRSRFGRSDFGVNAERVNRWLDELEPRPNASGG
jgi:uncharacterized protein (DUF1499 family)